MLETKQFVRNVGIRQRSLRKHCRFGRATELVYVLATGTMLTLASTDVMAQQTWTGATDGAWNNSPTSNNWTGGGGTDFQDDEDVIFNDGDGTITIDGAGVTSGNITVQDAGAGTLDITGGALTVGAGDTVDVETGAVADIQTTVTGDVTSVGDGNLELSGGVGGGVTQSGTGTTSVTAGTVTGDVSVTSGTLQVTGSATLSGSTTVSGGLLDIDGGTLSDVSTTTSGTVDMSSGTVGTLDQGSSGTSTVSGGSITGDVSVTSGTLQVTGSATLSGSTTVSGGLLDIDGGTLSDVDTTTSGTVDMSSGTVGTLDQGSSGTSTVSGGSITGDVSVTSGTLDFSSAVIGGNATFSGGTTNLGNGTDIQGATTNGSAGTVNVAGTVIGGTGFTNSGTLNIAGGATLTLDNVGTGDGTLTNTSGGTINAGNGSQISGNFVLNTGSTLSLVENTDYALTTVGTAVTINGDAVLNGTVALDADLSDGSVTGDTLTIEGVATGTVSFDFSTAPGVSGDVNNITVVSSGTTGDLNGLNIGSLLGLPGGLAFSYGVSLDGSGNLVLNKTAGGIGNLAAGVALTQSVVGSIVNRPTSPYVTDYVGYTGESKGRRLKEQASSDEPCGAGGWARVSVGQADVEGSFTDVALGDQFDSEQSINYYGIQTGGDIACFDDRFNGFDMSFGLVLGYNTGDTSSSTLGSLGVTDTQLNTDFSQSTYGLYATASRGSFFADLQVRAEDIDYEPTISDFDATNGTIQNISDFSTQGTTVSGAVGYSWPIQSVQGLNFVGTAGFSYSSFETDNISITGVESDGITAANSTLVLDDSSVELGFISGTLSRSRILPNEISAINYFGTLTVYNDFADDPTATVNTLDGLGAVTSSQQVELTNLGTYGEFSVGVNYIRLLDSGRDGAPRQLSAAARVDYRSGSSVDSYGITGQIRLQW